MFQFMLIFLISYKILVIKHIIVPITINSCCIIIKYITFSSTATFLIFHKNSSIENKNAMRQPSIRITNIPPTSLTSSSAESFFKS